MNLFEYAKVNNGDYDCCDNVYDYSVTFCFSEDYNEDFYKFCNEIAKKVEVVKQVDDCTLIVKWTDLIKRNIEKFRAFSKKHWHTQYDDEDDFIYEWIKEIHYYMAGYVSEDFYKILVNFVNTLE